MKSHRSDSGVMLESMRYLRGTSSCLLYQVPISRQFGLVMAAADVFRDSVELQENCVAVARNLAACDGLRRTLIITGGVGLVLNAMKAFGRHLGVQVRVGCVPHTVW